MANVRVLTAQRNRLRWMEMVLDILIEHGELTRHKVHHYFPEHYGARTSLVRLYKLGVLCRSDHATPLYRIKNSFAAFNCFYNISVEIDAIDEAIENHKKREVS